jgi:hypothetical protein
MRPQSPTSSHRRRGSAARARVALLLAAVLAAAACGTLGRLRARLRPPPPEPPPVLIPLDVYSPLPALSSALPRLPISTAKAAAERVMRNPELLQHLREIGVEYTGRRLPPLRWTMRVQRIEPVLAGKQRRPGSWDVHVVSTPIRGARTYYECELGFSFDGEPLRGGRPSQLCTWKDS